MESSPQRKSGGGRGKPLMALGNGKVTPGGGMTPKSESGSIDSRSDEGVDVRSMTATRSSVSLESVTRSFSDMMSTGSAASATAKRSFGDVVFEDRCDSRMAALHNKNMIVCPRPDFGKRGRPVQLETNFFVQKIPEGTFLYRYIVSVFQKPAVAFKKPLDLNDRGNKLDREDRRAAAYNAYKRLLMERSEVFPEPWKMCYDRSKLLFCLNKLDFGDGNQAKAQFLVENVDCDLSGPHDFLVRLEFQDEVRLDDKTSIIWGDESSNKNEAMQLTALQILDIITSQAAYYNGELTPFGRSFFRPNDEEVSLGHGRVMHAGFIKANRPILGPWNNLDVLPPEDHCMVALNIDSQKTAFYKPIPVRDFLNETLKRTGEIRFLKLPELKIFREHIKDVFVESMHRGTRFRFAVKDVDQACAKDRKFPMDLVDGGQKLVTVEEYYKQKYQILKYPELPLLIDKRRVFDEKLKKFQMKCDYYPLELFTVSKNQRVNYKRVTEEQSREIIKKAAVPPEKRREEIMKILHYDLATKDGPIDDFMQGLGIERATEMLAVRGRVIRPPKLKYVQPIGRVGDKEITPDNGSWDPRDARFLLPARCCSWALVYFDHSGQFDRVKRDTKDFALELAKYAKEKGMDWPVYPFDCFAIDKLCQVEATFKNIVRDGGSELDIIVCVVNKDWKQAYPEIKRVSEVLLDIPTQVVCTSTVYSAVQCLKDQNKARKAAGTFVHLTQKLNQKLGGINQQLVSESLELDVLAKVLKQPTILIGADVTHPPPQSREEAEKGGIKDPSIAAVVGTKDAAFTKYSTVIQVQDPRREIIDGMEEAVKELLFNYLQSNNGQKPEQLIFLRDGVSEGQFEQVLTNELPAILKACQDILGKQPGVTLVIVQKRHHARFFPTTSTSPRAAFNNAAKNIQAGTVVDTGPVHPQRFEFYLASHAGIQGTSKATKYVVIHDTNKFTQDVLQHLIFYLTHVYSRCNKSISLPAPVMYAHLAAARAKQHLIGMQQSSTEGGSGSDGKETMSCDSSSGVDGVLIEQLKEMEKAVRVGERLAGRLYYA